MGNLKSIILRNPSPSPADSVLTWSLASRLQPSERAAFAVTSRLLSSIVTESLLRSYYVPIHSEEARGICVILSANVMSEHHVLTRPLQPVDVFAIIPLHQEPIFSGTLSEHGRPIWLLDPLDMVPFIFEISTRDAGSSGVVCLRLIYISLTPFLIRFLAVSAEANSIFPCLSPVGARGACISFSRPRSFTLVEKTSIFDECRLAR
jgi:hypothetical protein